MAVTFLTNEDKNEMVLNTPQTLTPEQQAQARENIGATTAEEVSQIVEAKLSSIINAEGVRY